MIEKIKNWLRNKLFEGEAEKLRIEKKAVRFTPRQIRVVNEPQWTKNHAEALKIFLSAPVGRDLDAIMNCIEIRSNAYATRDLSGVHEEREYRAGFAWGLAFAFAQVRQMAVTAKEESESYTPTEEETEEIINNRIRGMI